MCAQEGAQCLLPLHAFLYESYLLAKWFFSVVDFINSPFTSHTYHYFRILLSARRHGTVLNAHILCKMLRQHRPIARLRFSPPLEERFSVGENDAGLKPMVLLAVRFAARLLDVPRGTSIRKCA